MKKLNFLDKNAINPLTTVGGAIAMKTQKLNVIFKSFRALALTAFVLLGVGNSWAYTITFTTAGTDQSTALTTSNFVSSGVSAGGTYISSCAGTDKSYVGKSGNKLGSSSAAGYFTLNLAPSGQIVNPTITIVSTKYGSDTGVLRVYINGIQTGGNITPGGTATLNFTGTITSIKVETSTKRAYVGSIDIAPSYAITASTNNASWGTVSVLGNVITAIPAAGYRVSTTTPYEVTSGTAEVVQNENVFTVSPSSNCAVRINFEAAPTYTLTWSVNGSTSTTTVVQGDAIGTLPTNPTSADCDNEKVFVGWTAEPYTHASVAPTYISTATVPSGNTTYYAVFAEGSAGVAVNTVLWAENFAHFGTKTPSVAGTGSGTTIYDNATITYTQSSTSTKAYNEKLAGGTAPELLLAKASGTWTISGIKTGGATGMSLTFLSNKTTFSLTSPTTGISITGSATSWTITATGSVTTFDLVLTNTSTGTNARVDNVELKVTESSSYVNYTTSCCTAITPTLSYSASVNVGQTLNPTLGGNDGSGTVTYSSSDISVLTVNSSTGEVTGVSAGTAKVTANIAANDGYCAGSVESSTITVSSGCTPATASFTLGTVNKTFGDANFTNTFNSNNTGTKTFSSSNTGVATVNASTGAVTIVGVGTATISVTQPETGSICAVNASYTLNVTCATLAVPSNFAAGTITHTTIDLSWTAVPNASSYTIEYTAGSTQTKSGITGTSTQLTGLTPSTAYSITIQAIGNGTTYCSSAKSGAINVSTTAIPTYTLTWNNNGSTSTTTVNQGSAIGTLPATPASCSSTYSTFVGWYTAASGSESSPSASPLGTQVTAATVPTANTTYYAVFADAVSSNATDLFISEYIEGSGNNKAIEIYNGTGASVDLSNYTVYLYSNGATDATQTLALTGTLANNDVYVIANASANATILGLADATDAVTNYNGDDAIALYNTSTSSHVDIFGRIGEDPGTAWTSGSHSTVDKTLVRKSTVSGGVTTNPSSGFPTLATEWDVYNQDYVDKIGFHTFTGGTSSTGYISTCCSDLAVVTLTPAASTINMPQTGNATTTIAFLQSGGGAGTWGDPSVLRLSGTGTASVTKSGTNINFSATGVGVYEVRIGYTETCEKVGKTTITVTATPVVTIVDVTPLTFTANCGEASVAQSVSVSGYNLTADMTATAPTNFLVSSDNSTYGSTATFTQTSGTASGTLYIKANPPAASTSPISGNVTLASTGATDCTLAVSATVSCSPVTVTFLDWDGATTVWNTYYAGTTQTLPVPPTGACAGWTFAGWTANNVTTIVTGDIIGKNGDNITLTGSTTYYAAYTLEGTGTTTIFIDDFADLVTAQTGGVTSRANWTTLTKVYVEAAPDNCQFKLGSSSAQGLATTIALSELTGNATLTFDLQTYASDNKDVVVTINNGTIVTASSATSTTSNTATYTTSSTKVTHTITLNGSATTTITFAARTSSRSRFYLDNVVVTVNTAAYTLSPTCCDINLEKPTLTTSSADGSVTVSWPSVKNAGVEAATSYSFTYKLTSSSAAPTVISVAATGAETYTKTITGLTNCSNYTFTVEAIGNPEANPSVCSSQIASVTTYPGESYTVTFNYGAGTGTPALWVSGCDHGTSINLPAVTPNSPAYVFEGWYDGTTKVGVAGDTYTPTQDVTLQAHYTEATAWTLSFVNGTDEICTKTVYETQSVDDRKASEPYANYTDYGFDENPFTTQCTDAIFVGWTETPTDPAGTTTKPALVTFPYTVSADKTLYALWKLTVESGGGTATDFVKVTETPDDWSGDYIIVNSDGTRAMSNTNPEGEMTTIDVTISANTISNPNPSSIWTVTESADDICTFYNEKVSRYLYITGTSSTNAGLSTTAHNLKITLKNSTDKIYQIGGTGTTSERCFAYYASNKTFRTYASTYNTGCLYRRVAGTTTYYSVPVCSPLIAVSETDVTNGISLDAALFATASSAGHVVIARNCPGNTISAVLTGLNAGAFSVEPATHCLTNGFLDSVYTVKYHPIAGVSHTASLKFQSEDGTVMSETITLNGTVCESAQFGPHSSTDSTISIVWTAPLPGAKLHVWNDIVEVDPCATAPQPYDQEFILNTETTKTISGLSASTLYHYQIINGSCASVIRDITTKDKTGIPLLTASPMLWEPVAEANNDSVEYTFNLTGTYMPNATVAVAVTNTGAGLFKIVPEGTTTVTLDGSGNGTVTVRYVPTKPQTTTAMLTLSYESDCETKTVNVALVGNVPGFDIVEVTPTADGFILHTELEGNPNIVLYQEVEHQGNTRKANDIFFSKYFEASQSVKLLGIYNGTSDTISLKGMRIAGQKAEVTSKVFTPPSTDIINLDTLQEIAPGKELILFSTGTTSGDRTVINCVAGDVGWEHEGWYPVGNTAAREVYNDESRNLFGGASVSTGGSKMYALQRKNVGGTWDFIDLIGACDGDSVIGRHLSKTIPGSDDSGWECENGTEYGTKDPVPLSTNRHLLIRKNTVVDGLNAVESNTEDFTTLCLEWEGKQVPKGGIEGMTEQEITCQNFQDVASFNYDGYYIAFERTNEDLVDFQPIAGEEGNYYGKFQNPQTTFQDTLRCYNLKVSAERYYNSLETPPVEMTKAEIELLDPDDPTDANILANLDTVEVMSTQYRVPIIVKSGEILTTQDSRFTDLSRDTCKTCDVVILKQGVLTKTNNVINDRDSLNNIYVYSGGRLVVPEANNLTVRSLQIRANGDTVGSAYVEGNLKMDNPRIIHDKRIDNSKYYFFTLPYDCSVKQITEMNGKSLGLYGTSWAIKYYDGASRIENRGLESNWKLVPSTETLRAGKGYVIAIASEQKKFVRFPMVVAKTFTEKDNTKAINVTMYGYGQAQAGTLGYNNVGWNLVGNPYITYFSSDSSGTDGVNNGTIELSGEYQKVGQGITTWELINTDKIYVTVPSGGAYAQFVASQRQLSPFISFFVQAQATGTLTFSTDSRNQAPMMVSGVKSEAANPHNIVALDLNVNGNIDRTTFIINDAYTKDYEVGYDLLKWKGSWAKIPYVYSFDNENNPLAFNALSYDSAREIMPIGFYMPTNYAPYTFSINQAESDLNNLEHVYLLYKGSVVADLLVSDYTNTNIKRMAENKDFAITIQRAGNISTPIIETPTEGLVPYAWTSGHDLKLAQLPAEGNVIVRDAVGRIIASAVLTGDDTQMFTLPCDGVYVVSVINKQNNYTIKVVMQ